MPGVVTTPFAAAANVWVDSPRAAYSTHVTVSPVGSTTRLPGLEPGLFTPEATSRRSLQVALACGKLMRKSSSGAATTGGGKLVVMPGIGAVRTADGLPVMLNQFGVAALPSKR